jgi:hypothetical protein
VGEIRIQPASPRFHVGRSCGHEVQIGRELGQLRLMGQRDLFAIVSFTQSLC